MKRIGDLTLFNEVGPDELARFPAEHPRTVRLTVNTVGAVALSVIALEEDGTIAEDVKPMFLTTADGLDDVEFYAHGPFALTGDGSFYLKSMDGVAVHVEAPEAQTFTRIAERRARNPEIERLQAMLLQNQERRMGAMYEEVRREREQLEYDRAAFEHQRESDSEHEEPAAQSVQADDGPDAQGGSDPAPAKRTASSKSVS